MDFDSRTFIQSWTISSKLLGFIPDFNILCRVIVNMLHWTGFCVISSAIHPSHVLETCTAEVILNNLVVVQGGMNQCGMIPPQSL